MKKKNPVRSVLRKLAKRLRQEAESEIRKDAIFHAMGLKRAAEIADEWADQTP